MSNIGPSMFCRWVKACPKSSEAVVVIGVPPDEDISPLHSCSKIVKVDPRQIDEMPVEIWRPICAEMCDTTPNGGFDMMVLYAAPKRIKWLFQLVNRNGQVRSPNPVQFPKGWREVKRPCPAMIGGYFYAYKRRT